MQGPVVVGYDGSPESLAATDWAAREALRRSLPLELVQAWPWSKNHELGGDNAVQWAKRQLSREQVELRGRLTGLEVSGVHIPDEPAAVLEAAANRATLLVLGSRGLSSIQGFLVGSVSQEVLGRATCPVVLVRAGAVPEDEHQPDAEGQPSTGTPFRDVALGLDLRHPYDAVLAFGFEAALLRSAPLRVVHVWGPPTGGSMAYGVIAGMGDLPGTAETQAVTEVLQPWQDKYPQVEVIPQTIMGSAAYTLVEATSQAGLLVVGRRKRHGPVGPRLGPVAHAALHHASCSVAVVPSG
ncbi:universal stress protein [Kitasatospora sp. CMC57]|uniref:Universal stress protein n=1 Tax=Kitasatospora sp. CMC57 TaxID=3231513 RepID=A0AB33K3K2_9ACTN